MALENGEYPLSERDMDRIFALASCMFTADQEGSLTGKLPVAAFVYLDALRALRPGVVSGGDDQQTLCLQQRDSGFVLMVRPPGRFVRRPVAKA